MYKQFKVFLVASALSLCSASKIFLVAFVLSLCSVNLFAQVDLNSSAPSDPNVKKGVLKNGLTYYIRSNKEPKDRASFYIIQNVGAMLENDDQNGLAHFLEHMAFNGTKNFPEKALIGSLEKHGVKFGENLNAYTSLDETVYNISDVPTTNTNYLDSCLLMLHDWSHYLTLSDKEIDEERGVIREEWRTRRNAGFRIYRKTADYVFKDSKYSKRDAIGDMNIINNFKYDVLRQYYKKWYRPDLQAIAVVGDFDASQMEQKVKELFSEIPAVQNPATREFFPVPDHEAPIFGLATDPEETTSSINIFIKHPSIAPKDKNLGTWRQDIMNGLYSSMFGDRIAEILQQKNPPFINASVGYGPFLARTCDFYMISADARNNDEATALAAIMKENARVVQHGFTATELERAKSNLLTQIESSYKSRDKRSNDSYCREMSRNFTVNEPMPGIEYEYDFYKKLLPGITLDEINALAPKWMTKENRTIVIAGPEKADIKHLTEAETFAIIDKAENTPVEAYVDKVPVKTLMPVLPQGGKVVAVKQLPEFKAEEWKLSNGARVVYRYSDLNKDQMLLSVQSPGGTSLLSKEYLPSAMYTASLVDAFGVADYDPMTLNKILTGKNVSLNLSLGELSEGMSGRCSPKDFESLLQLVYLYFEKPRFDQTIYTSTMDRIKSMLQNAQNNPRKVMSDSLTLLVKNYNPRVFLQNLDNLNKVSLDKVRQIYLDRFKNASDFTFYFVGNLQPEEAKPLVERYIGSIDAGNRKEHWVDHHLVPPYGMIRRNIPIKQDVSKATIVILYSGKIPYTAETDLKMSILKGILDIRYVASVREKEGGTYGVGVMGNVAKLPEQQYRLLMSFECDPAKAAHLTPIIYQELDEIANKGPLPEDFDKVIKNLKKVRTESFRENGFWLNALNSYYWENEDIVAPSSFESIIDKVKPSDIKAFTKTLLKGKNRMEITFQSEKK